MKSIIALAFVISGCAGLGNLGGQQYTQDPPRQLAPMPQMAPIPMPAQPMNCATTCYGGTCYTRC